MKKLHLAFGIIAIIMTLAAIVIAFVAFANTAQSEYTGFPSWSIFVFVGIYYFIGLFCLTAVWLVLWLILRRRYCKN